MAKLVYPISGTYHNEPVDVSVIVPMYKSFSVVQEQILRWVTDDDLKTEVIYVDDLCPKGSKRAVFQTWNKRRDCHKHLVKIILSETNLGFGGACNLGVHYANGKYVVVLNADTIVTPNWIMPMVETLGDEKIGLVGNLQLKDGGEWHGSIDGAGSEWSWESMNFMHIGRHIYNGEVLDKPFFPENAPVDMLQLSEREMVTGCCMAARKDLWTEVGGFNPSYRIGYWEDSELCLTLREMGYKVMLQPESVIYHKLHHSESGNHPFTTLNRDYFYNKWIGSQRIDPLVKAKRTVRPVKVGNILVRRQAAHGDVLMAASVLPAIKKKHPKAKIYFSTVCGEMLNGNPHIDHVIKESEAHKQVYQLTYNMDLSYERRPHTNILQAYADEVGVKMSECRLDLARTSSDHLVPAGTEFVVIHAGKTAWVGRNWLEERFDEVAERINRTIVCIGHTGDHFVPCGNYDLRGKTSIGELADVIARAKLFVGIDSLPMHIAQAMNTPGVCFFGCILPETRIIRKNMIGVNAKGLKCIGCHHNMPPPRVALTECPNGTCSCEKEVTVDHLWKEIQCLLNV